MQKFKIEHFEREHPELQFPLSQLLTSTQSTELVTQLAHHVAVSVSIQSLHSLLASCQTIHGVDAEAEHFRADSLLENLKVIPPDSVFVLWLNSPSEIEQIKYSVFIEYFEYIWYPSSDDIIVFDNSFHWILFITHEGEVRFFQSQ